MANEQEGIDLGTINPNGDTIILPDVDDVEGVQNETGTDTPTQTDNNIPDNTTVDDDKTASLQRGLNKERKLRKEAERKNKEIEARLKVLEEAAKEKEKSTLDTLLESGIDEEVAKSISKAIDKKQASTASLEKEIADLKFKESLAEKSKEEGYEDIEDFADEIKDLVDKGLTVEQSYHALSYDKPQTKNTASEIQRKLEAKMQNQNARKEILGNINNNAGASNNSKKINLTALEKAVAAAAGMTAEEYATMRDIDNAKEYNEYKSKKK